MSMYFDGVTDFCEDIHYAGLTGKMDAGSMAKKMVILTRIARGMAFGHYNTSEEGALKGMLGYPRVASEIAVANDL